MTEYIARKALTAYGRHYDAGEVVDLSVMSPKVRNQLISQKRVLPRETAEDLRYEVSPIVDLGGGWFEVQGEKVRGRGAAERKLETMEG